MKSKCLHLSRRYIERCEDVSRELEIQRLTSQYDAFTRMDLRTLKLALTWGGEAYDGLRRLAKLGGLPQL